ncbi:polysaccharide deacetylase family protein [Salipiger sp.]|uniref:polysaccharide deacetylase family protein n=1 Tax=Salipiger sp. TaxID=2078585 RepID=UPI003A96BCDC
MHVTLTFDNGPDPEETPKVLAILERYGIRATFFLVAGKLRDPAMREMAVRTHAAGHWIGNHTMSHGLPLGLVPDPDVPAREIDDAQALLGELSHPDRLFRPNGKGRVGRHLLSRGAMDRVVAGRYTVALWGVMPRDGGDPPGWPGRAMAYCEAREWSSVVVHDRVRGGMGFLEPFIEMVLKRGGSFRQESPPDVIPIHRGVLSPWAEMIVNDDPAARAAAFFGEVRP